MIPATGPVEAQCTYPGGCRTDPSMVCFPTLGRIGAAIALVVSLSCDDGSDLPAPVLHGRRALHPDARGAIRRCQAALDSMFSLPLEEQLNAAVSVCAELYLETGCRSAMENLGGVDGPRRSEYLAAACQRAYCSSLPSPKPGLCHVRGERSLGQMDPEALRALWREFNSAVFLRDLATAHPLEGVVFRYLETVPRDSALRRPAARPGAVRLRLEPRRGSYALIGAGRSVESSSTTLLATRSRT